MEKRILIVEDESEVSAALAELLGGEFATAVAASSSDALEAIAANQPDLILLDMILARGTGIEVLKAVAQMASPIPVLVLTGYARDLNLAAFGSVVADVIPKPFAVTDLLSRIRQVADGRGDGLRGQVPGREGKGSVLLVEDDQPLREALTTFLEEAGYLVRSASTPEEALAALKRGQFDAVVADWILPGASGLDLLQRVRTRTPGLPVVLMTGYATESFIRRALAGGAADVLVKPFPPQALPLTLEKCLQRQAVVRDTHHVRGGRERGAPTEAPAARYTIDAILGESEAIRRSRGVLVQVARMDSPVLIQGETGTGKELAAQAVHAASQRRTGPYVAINTAALPESLIESELFGYGSGAFTGAKREGHQGKFVQANGGTLFLDEIGDMPLPLQAKLLRVLEDGVVTPLAGTAQRVDVRVVAATHRDLPAMIREGRFRSDLYFRLGVMMVHLPPLRDRYEDVGILATQFLDQLASRYGRAARLSEGALEVMLSHHWPGNVRELRNAMEYAYAVASGDLILPAQLPPGIQGQVGSAGSGGEGDEQRRIAQALATAGGNRTHAAKLLGMSRSNLYLKLKIYGFV